MQPAEEAEGTGDGGEDSQGPESWGPDELSHWVRTEVLGTAKPEFDTLGSATRAAYNHVDGREATFSSDTITEESGPPTVSITITYTKPIPNSHIERHETLSLGPLFADGWAYEDIFRRRGETAPLYVEEHARRFPTFLVTDLVEVTDPASGWTRQP
jgi:hypothetical protein